MKQDDDNKKDLDLIYFFLSSPTYFSCLVLFYPNFLEERKEREMELFSWLFGGTKGERNGGYSKWKEEKERGKEDPGGGEYFWKIVGEREEEG